MSRRIINDELEFEVPYGKLSAKTWHEETDECKRILVLHGWMDNSGSFDNLMPHIKNKEGIYAVALDLPGHGRSSQLPPGSSYSDLNIVMEIRRCVVELEWNQSFRTGGRPMQTTTSTTNNDNSNNISCMTSESNSRKKFSILGHSLGAGMGLLYSSLYPEDVEEVILVDFLKSKTKTVDKVLQEVAETIDQFISTVPSMSPFASPILSKSITFRNSNNNKNTDKGQVVVSQETAIVATIEAHKGMGLLTREDACCLLKRSTVAVSTPANSVIYSRDLRLQSMLNLREHWEINKIMFAGVRCHVLCLLAKSGMYKGDEYKEHMDEMEKILSSQAKSIHIRWLEGDHYIHMNNVKETADSINKYLAVTDKSSIWSS